MKLLLNTLLAALLFLCACKQTSTDKAPDTIDESTLSVVLDAENFVAASDSTKTVEKDSLVSLGEGEWLSYELNITNSGRYQVVAFAKSAEGGTLWVEDYIDNKDGRTYNITGSIDIPAGTTDLDGYGVFGSPLAKGVHKIKLHASKGAAEVYTLMFKPMRMHEVTPKSLTQSMEGDNWKLAWSDEFDGAEVDTSKWTYDVGDWGWGNNELQYYTVNRKENARVEDGHLIIEAVKEDMGKGWSSARLTTRGKVSFLYGKIEFKAKVPREKGNWAAGWTLGDSYVDELSWPYCGEIDILESVGYEVNDETGDGIAHATVHTPAYYFKINNQISSTKEVKNIAGEFHTYAVEWTPTEVKGFVDGEEYYLYDKTANEKEWPFNQPQNIILNLAMGGGWGGAQGMDPTVTSQKFILDYVRVYGKE